MRKTEGRLHHPDTSLTSTRRGGAVKKRSNVWFLLTPTEQPAEGKGGEL